MAEAVFRHMVAEEGLVARGITRQDFGRFDYIIALDSGHMAHLKRIAPRRSRAKLRIMMDGVADSPAQDVPDPYYTGQFDLVYDMVRQGCRALLHEIKEAERPSH